MCAYHCDRTLCFREIMPKQLYAVKICVSIISLKTNRPYVISFTRWLRYQQWKTTKTARENITSCAKEKNQINNTAAEDFSNEEIETSKLVTVVDNGKSVEIHNTPKGKTNSAVNVLIGATNRKTMSNCLTPTITDNEKGDIRFISKDYFITKEQNFKEKYKGEMINGMICKLRWRRKWFLHQITDGT